MSRIVWAWFLVGLFVVPVSARYGGGLGTVDQPYLISTAAHLNTVAATPSDWSKYFRLTANLDMRTAGATPFAMIGTLHGGPFTGVFDGNYKTIANLRIVSDGGSYLGLFGLVDATRARIANLTLVDPNVSDEAARYVGALAGLFSNGTISNCHVRNGHILGSSLVGGLVGENMKGTVVDCTAVGAVYGNSRVGGLLGENLLGTVTRCQATGEVRGEASSWTLGGLVGENQGTVGGCRASGSVRGGDRVGGLIGDNVAGLADCCYAAGAVRGTNNVGGLVGQNTAGDTTDCYALASVTAVKAAGGLVGFNGPSCDCTEYESSHVVRCYAAGPVSGSQTGGLVAVNYRSTVETSFWDSKTTGCSTSDGGSAGKTPAQMFSLSTYTGARWDFTLEKTNGTEDLWCMPIPRSYPRLAWEVALGDFNGDERVDLRDYALLAQRWEQADTGFLAGGRFVAPDGVIDFDDLANWADLWLSNRW